MKTDLRNRHNSRSILLALATLLIAFILEAAAASLQSPPMQVALAWLLQRSPNILLIPGTSSVEHLRENLKAATLQLPPEIITNLDLIG